MNYEKHKVLEWELTDKGNFYYRIYPTGDKHYSDYALIRMAESDMEQYDLTMKYIWAGGYVGTNIFLIDWTEDDFGDLSFDIFESLYYDCYGKQFRPEGYEFILEQGCCKIPAAEFEEVVLPYFDIDLYTFREMAQYDAEGDDYPWRQRPFLFLANLTRKLAAATKEMTEYKSVRDKLRTADLEQENDRLRSRLRTYEDAISRNNL